MPVDCATYLHNIVDIQHNIVDTVDMEHNTEPKPMTTEVTMSHQEMQLIAGLAVESFNVTLDGFEWFYSYTLDRWVRVDDKSPVQEVSLLNHKRQLVMRQQMTTLEALRCCDAWNVDMESDRNRICFIELENGLIPVESGLSNQLSLVEV